VGGTSDSSTGFTNLGAREYDTTNGRFLSADPVLDTGDPQQMNEYAYADDNPVSKSDPTGLLCNTYMDGGCENRPTPAPSPPPSGGGGGGGGGGSHASPIRNALAGAWNDYLSQPPPPPARPAQPTLPPCFAGKWGHESPCSFTPEPNGKPGHFDYIIYDFSIGPVSISFTRTHYGDAYLSVGDTVGPCALLACVSVRGGKMITPASRQQIGQFLQGWSGSVCGAVVVTACDTWGNPGTHMPRMSELSSEVGVGVPGASVSYTYGIHLSRQGAHGVVDRLIKNPARDFVQGLVQWSYQASHSIG
jgi:RHS repeat-associated protein